MPIASSELILNDDGSIYHLNLLPGDLATTIITVGDQERVFEISKYFDEIEIKKHKREFTCHTGYIGAKRISVISTGIGTDNIDIVFNEIDALFNVDFETREIKEEITVLNFIRLGTSGSLQEDIPLGQFLISEIAVGIDNMNAFYEVPPAFQDLYTDTKVTRFFTKNLNAYSVKADKSLVNTFASHPEFIKGKTLTSIGFYAPQGRAIRYNIKANSRINQVVSAGITNLEMETSGIYLLASVLGHRAVSINAILANRQLGTFAENPGKVVDNMIKKALNIIVEL
ncbi:nucleoside phosphorylase [Portibacter lacus]|uniref:Phosphorylase n=1 Tax=Portibacter lacus TaxID=1099794 RepID=A0AA37WD12_9BACT|nr:nucleoside phosphorylase [Portibacter lacus]GLR16348.1 phosphorylase [Portibacter lacus]